MNPERLEWLKWRRAGIGSSDVGAIVGVSPYMTKYDLWEDKTSDVIEESESNYAMDKGNELEPKARNYFAACYSMENMIEEDFAPRLVQSASFPHLRASLDGSSKNGETIIEIKHQGKDAHEAVKKGLVPEKYYPQLQHGLGVSQAKRAFFVSIDIDENVCWTEVLPNQSYIENMFEKCHEFWRLVQSKTPPEFVQDDFKLLRYKGATEDVRQFLATGICDRIIENAKKSNLKRLRIPGIRILNGITILKESNL